MPSEPDLKAETKSYANSVRIGTNPGAVSWRDHLEMALEEKALQVGSRELERPGGESRLRAWSLTETSS
jgi:hypothetical protein